MATYLYAPTVTPDNFDAEEDAKNLKECMKGLGTDEDVIIEILAKRASFQRMEIAKEYKTLFGSDLLEDLQSELGGHFEQVVVALLTPISEYLASEVHNTMSGAGTDEEAIVEIMCPMTNKEMTTLKLAYERLYGKSLEDALENDTSGDFKRLLVSLTTANREESRDVDDDKAKEDAQALVDAGENVWGTDETAFLSVMASRSFPQLKLIFENYESILGKSIEDAISSELSGSIKDGFLAIAKCALYSPVYFAERLNHALKGLGTNDPTVIRIIVTRCEMDLQLIKDGYMFQFNESLEDAISGDTSGDYQKILLALLKSDS